MKEAVVKSRKNPGALTPEEFRECLTGKPSFGNTTASVAEGSGEGRQSGAGDITPEQFADILRHGFPIDRSAVRDGLLQEYDADEPRKNPGALTPEEFRECLTGKPSFGNTTALVAERSGEGRQSAGGNISVEQFAHILRYGSPIDRSRVRDAVLQEYSPDQSRDWHGRWTDGGSGGPPPTGSATAQFSDAAHRIRYRRAANGSYDYDPKIDPAFNKELKDRAKLAVAAYNRAESDARRDMPKGWTYVQHENYEMKDREEKKTAISAHLFRNNQTGKYVLAFRGTKITNLADAATNFAQGTGLPSGRYDAAMWLARVVSNELRQKQKGFQPGDLEVVGHSLGGGLATAAAVANGLKATVFNPAGIHANTMADAIQFHFNRERNASPTREQEDQYKREMHDRIDAFAVRYELLTSLQDKPGIAGLVMPHTFGTVYNMSKGDWYEKAVDRVKIGDVKVLALPVVRGLGLATIGIDRHLMSSVLKALGDES
jgi:hypothetical protein